MKQILMTLLMITTLSCHSDLDITQNNQLSSLNMWEDDADFESATYGLYTYMRGAFKTDIIYWGEYRSGLWGPGTHGTLQNNAQAAVASSTMSATSAYASWTDIYTTINMTNLIIKYTPALTEDGGSDFITDTTKRFALANAHYVRAICYFWLARIWGDVPLAMEGFESTANDMYLARSPKSEVYKLVIDDITTAEKYIQTSYNDKTVVTPSALAMLKADFALWMYTDQKAGDSYLNMAESAIASLKLESSKLESEFGNIFNSTTKLGIEVIFALHQDSGESLGGFPIQHLWSQGYIEGSHIENPVPVGDNQWWFYTDAYINLIANDPSDKRTSITYGHGPYGSGGVEVRWPNKYIGQVVAGTRVFDSDIIFYRYGQAYLFDAEIKYYQKNYNGALQSLSAITKRAYDNPAYYTDATPDAVLNAIVTENLKEFACEGNIWWTLVRTDKVWDYNTNLANQKEKTNILLWPITQSAMNKNYNLKQTKGWI